MNEEGEGDVLGAALGVVRLQESREGSGQHKQALLSPLELLLGGAAAAEGPRGGGGGDAAGGAGLEIDGRGGSRGRNGRSEAGNRVRKKTAAARRQKPPAQAAIQTKSQAGETKKTRMPSRDRHGLPCLYKEEDSATTGEGEDLEPGETSSPVPLHTRTQLAGAPWN